MSAAARRLELARIERAAAWETFEVRLAQVQDDLAERGVGGRIADRVGQGARETLDHALEVADENPGIIAGTAAAVVLWLLRNPLINLAKSRFGNDEESADDDDQ